MVTKPIDLTRTTLAVLSILGLIAVSFLVLQPFLAATVWAATLVVATWPVMRRLQSAFGGRRGAAVTVMTLVLLVLVVLPLFATLVLPQHSTAGISTKGVIATAHAVVGRPLTPVSVAGVARRTARRCANGAYEC